jgi:hypothetical protein
LPDLRTVAQAYSLNGSCYNIINTVAYAKEV